MWSSFNVVVESSQKYKNKFSLRFRDSYSSREQRTLFVVIHSCKYIPIYSCSLQHIFIKSLLQFFQYNPLFQQRISRGHFITKRALFVHSIQITVFEHESILILVFEHKNSRVRVLRRSFGSKKTKCMIQICIALKTL